jgi:hypothetical protein
VSPKESKNVEGEFRPPKRHCKRFAHFAFFAAASTI